MESVLSKKRLLWVDDDGKKNFRFEAYCLKKAGLDIDWAESGEQAFEKLSQTSYDILVLDQIFPWKTHGKKTEWGGCRVLHWLRSQQCPEDAPHEPSWDPLSSASPLAENRGIPVFILSAFYDEDIDRNIRALSPEVPIEEKPIDEERLLKLLEGAFEGPGRAA